MDACFDVAIQQLNLRECSTSNAKEDSDERNFQQYDEDEDSYEFSFACAEAASSPISADDLFHNGQIRPISPVFGNGEVQRAASTRNPSEEAFVERRDPQSESHCEQTETAPAPVTCRKSNSTGFSKLWRFRDMLIRSQSDGKETFVFLTENEDDETTTSCTASFKRKKKSENPKNDKNSSAARDGKKGSADAETKTTSSKPKGKTTSSSAYAMQYGKNWEKAKEKRRSYLPYRQDLVGFFTNANAVTRNIHPY
ncbi:hypothetical protein V2J09_015435 [Rumex salicifolius]